MKRNIDDILRQALTPEIEPDVRLNRKILYEAKEKLYMAKKRKSRIPAAALAACMTLLIGSTGVYAAWIYLSPAQMAEKVDDRKLSEAFQGEDAVLVNETLECGGYRITLLGAVAGKNISEFLSADDQGQVKEDMFYAAVAIERADGMPMPDTSDEDYGEETFYASPYIRGLDPQFYSIMSMGGGYSEFVENGVQYRLLEMENIEMFADRGIYIGVSSGDFYDSSAYIYDESTGEMIRNESYDGVNALFNLPLDPAKADRARAEQYLEELQKGWETSDESMGTPATDEDVETWIDMAEAAVKEGTLEECAVLIESAVQVCIPDENGVFQYSWELESGRGSSAMDAVSNSFPDGKPGTTIISGYSISEGLEDLVLETYTLNEDGTVTVGVWIPKE